MLVSKNIKEKKVYYGYAYYGVLVNKKALNIDLR